MIFVGETVDRKREVVFELVDIADTDLRLLAHTFATGEITAASPGGSIANVDVSRIREIGGGAYAYALTDAQVLLAGSGVLLITSTLSTAVADSIEFTVEDPGDFGAVIPDGATALLPIGTVTLASVRELVRQRGDYLSVRKFTNAYVNSEIQAAWTELFELMDDVCEGWWDTQDTTPTVANIAYAVIPATCKRVLSVDILDGSDYRELRQVGTGDRNRFGTGTGKPVAYRLSSRGIELHQTPDAVYTLRVLFSPICPALHESAGIELYGLHEYIVTSALLRLDQREERPITERMAELGRQRERVVRAAAKRKQQEPDYLNLREGGGSSGPWHEDSY